MKKIFAPLLFVLPILVLADTAGGVRLTRFLADMTITRNGWCEVEGGGPDGIVEYRKAGEKKAYELFTATGHYVLVEVKRKTYGVARFYFSISNEVRLDATEHHDASAWEERMGNQQLLIMAYFPDMERSPPGCQWGRKKER